MCTQSCHTRTGGTQKPVLEMGIKLRGSLHGRHELPLDVAVATDSSRFREGLSKSPGNRVCVGAGG